MRTALVARDVAPARAQGGVQGCPPAERVQSWNGGGWCGRGLKRPGDMEVAGSMAKRCSQPDCKGALRVSGSADSHSSHCENVSVSQPATPGKVIAGWQRLGKPRNSAV